MKAEKNVIQEDFGVILDGLKGFGRGIVAIYDKTASIYTDIQEGHITKEDISEAVRQTLRSFGRGAGEGLYTPIAIFSGIRQFNDNLYNEERSDLEILSHWPTWFTGICTSTYGLALYAINEDKALQVGLVLLATNTIDYLANAYRRSKE